MTAKYFRIAVPLTLAAILAGACSSNDASPNTGAAPSQGATNTIARTSTASSPTNTRAADLRVILTSVLQEHVYLTGITTGAALQGADHRVPAATLDENSVALSKVFASAYGGPAGEQFLALWRKHIGMFIDYMVGTVTDDGARKAKARVELDGYGADFGAFVSSANPNLTKEAVAMELTPHVATMTAAIDAQGAKDPSATAKLQDAAEHMSHMAGVLAGAMAMQFPDKFPG